MTAAYETAPLDFPSAPIEGDTLAVVKVVANDWLADRSWRLFVAVCEYVAEANGGLVFPDEVRADLTQADGELAIRPQRLSAFYQRAASKAGFLDFSHWGVNGDVKGGNAGKPARIYKLRSNA